ncbi:58 kDa phosphoprotein-like isoform X8 [Periplaneta americana]|uniref:58 kDa phosphoprotein-like isoform X8 n=1 Tax=Periplaneta americana TaxID=6978 RepID=UPI0037E955A8
MLVKIVCIALTLQGIVAVPYQRVKRSSDLVEVPKIPRGLPVLSGVSGGLPLIGGGSGGLPILGGGPSGLLQGGKGGLPIVGGLMDGLPLVGGLTGGSDVLSGGKGVLAPVQDLPVVGGVAKGLL